VNLKWAPPAGAPPVDVQAETSTGAAVPNRQEENGRLVDEAGSRVAALAMFPPLFLRAALRVGDVLDRALGAVPAGILLLALAHMVLLGLGVHLMDKLPFWFWPMRDKSIVPVSALLLLMPIPAVAWLVVEGWPRALAKKIAILMVLGYGMQFGLALSEDRGLNALRDRIVVTGHAEFLRIAAQQRDVVHLLRHYESLAATGELGSYTQSKPPGQLLLYVATYSVANGFSMPPARVGLPRAATFATFVWPLFAYLALVPLFAVARLFMADREALFACLLYAILPSVSLIALHTDEAFYPLMVLTVVWLTATSVEPGRRYRALLAGGAAYLAGFCSFALLLTIPLGVCAAVARGAAARTGWKPVALAVTCMGVAFVGTDAAFRLAFHYDATARCAHALAFHAAWKHSGATAADRYYFAVLDLLEFALWTGVPVFCLALSEMGRSVRRALRGNVSSFVLPALAVAGLTLFVSFVGDTKAESARLWLFLTPFFAILAVRRLGAYGRLSVAMAATVLFEWGTTLLTKAHQDFW
jgi:hypothetical protein